MAVGVAGRGDCPDFGDLQLWRSEADGQLVFYLFDVLWLEGSNVTNLPLKERHQLLQTIIPSGDNVIKISEQFNTSGKDFFSLAEQLRLEGIFAKRSGSIYTPGNRSKDKVTEGSSW